MMRLLLIASDPMEFTGILARTVQARRVPLPVDWARSARLGGHEVVLVANGVGAKRAAAAVDAAAAQSRPDAVISTGFCGALEDDLNIADVITATSIQDETGAQYFAAVPLPNVRSGPICSLDRVAQTREEKQRLRSSGACAVEMEAAGVAAHAQALGVAFHCVKAVTDLAGETMANDFNAALRSDGHFDTMLILRGSLRHPTVRLPELLRLRNRCVRAARVLGEFIANCRF